MPFNGSGSFSRVHDWTTDRDNGVNISASRMDEEFDGVATALTACLTKTGESTPTSSLPMGGFAHTNVGNATARNQYATVDQIQDNEYVWVDGGGTADAITATYSPAVTAVVDGMELKVRATAANATTTPTFAPNGLTARTITKVGGTALVAGDIVGDNHELTLRYYAASTRWELLNPGGFDVKAAPTGTVVGTSDTQTLTNKKFTDSSCTFVDNGDATKQLAFECSGITAGNTRTVTIPDKSGTMAMTSDIISASQITNTLGADVALNNTSSSFDGPSVAQGSTGTWLAFGTVTLHDTSGAASFVIKMHDGTTTIASARTVSTGASNPVTVSLSGYLPTPAGNLRISVQDATSTSGKILFNASGLSKDSNITAIRIA